MKAMILNEYGQSAEFQQTEIAKPEARPGHVVVRIAATSVNTVDTMIRSMDKDLPLSPDLPAVLGMDFAGTVETWVKVSATLHPAMKSLAAPAVLQACKVGLLNTCVPMPDLLRENPIPSQ
ncbi:MAG: alcohol dehydrogenase catalytic domain-containing protein [Pseudomonadota bacterium]